jgi:hypothetical protein
MRRRRVLSSLSYLLGYRQAGPAASPVEREEDRRGATLIVVIGLLGLLSLIGFFFYMFAKQEKSNAEYYAEAAKVREAHLDADALFDWGLKQIIQGAPAHMKHSALWGGRHSLLANMFGRNAYPHSGSGIKIVDQGGLPAVDENYDGNGNLASQLLHLNDSPTARNGGGGAPINPMMNPSSIYPSPDVDYTYPDINNMFLAYNGYGLDSNNRPVHVIIPSFHRPQYLREHFGGTGPVVSIYDWTEADGTGTTLTDTTRRVLRPHKLHRNVQIPDQPPTRRFIWDQAQADALGATRGPFPSLTGNDSPDPNAATFGNQGAFDVQTWQPDTPYRKGQWVVPPTPNSRYYQCYLPGVSGGSEPDWPTGAGQQDVPFADGDVFWRMHFHPHPSYDADADGSGIKEAIWLDLDFPIQEDHDGNKFIPLWAITIYDADGLLNLNAHGNVFGNTNLMLGPDPADPPFGNWSPISRSNMGIAPSEVNPLWGFTSGYYGDDVVGNPFDQHEAFYGRQPQSWLEAANMEWWYLNMGRPEYDTATGSVVDAFRGRWGDLDRLAQGVSTRNPLDFPRPGRPGIDDNNTEAEAHHVPEVGGITSAQQFDHPLDYRGSGRGYVLDTAANRFVPRRQQAGPNGLNGWLAYEGFDNGLVNGVPTNILSIWGQAFGGALLPNPTPNSTRIDEPSEVIHFGGRWASEFDKLFNWDDLAYLHLSDEDNEELDLASRLKRLAPHNLGLDTNDGASARAELIRKMYTVESWNLENFDVPWFGGGESNPPANPMNPGNRFTREWTATAGHPNDHLQAQFRFPPVFAGTVAYGPGDPFRPELRYTLEVIANRLLYEQDGTAIDARRAQRRLRFNQILDVNPQTGEVFYRDLIPHPVNAGASASNDQSTGSALREFRARVDRQRLCRDIYVLLYTLGGGHDGRNYMAESNAPDINGNRPLYTDEQLREMAQFAVNMVDALDRDNVITKFEYQKDLGPRLSDPDDPDSPMLFGWQLDDDPATEDFPRYDPTDPRYDRNYPEDGLERGVVYGVEAQRLTISEALVIYARPAGDPPQDHEATLHNDTQARVFSYIELRNPNPFPVSFQGGAWQIVIEQNTPTPDPQFTRKLTLLANAGEVPAGELYLIGSASDADTLNPTNSEPFSEFWADPEHAGGVPDWDANTHRLAPRVSLQGNPNALDVINSFDASGNVFRLLDGNDMEVTTNDGLINPQTLPDPGMTSTSRRIILRRRAHPTRTTPALLDDEYDAENPWIEVDRMVIHSDNPDIDGNFGLVMLDLQPGETGALLLQKLRDLRSQERRQPLNRVDQEGYPLAAYPDDARVNSLGQDNEISINPAFGGYGPTGVFPLYQQHFDRPFASSIDLLNVPLYAPHELTRWLAVSQTQPENQYQQTANPDAPMPISDFGRALMASAKFLRPEHPWNTYYRRPMNDTDPTQVRRRFDNRWHRLLSFVEVPTRSHRHPNLPERLKYRKPGQINWNTVRYPEVLAGLLDEPEVIQPGQPGVPPLPNDLRPLNPLDKTQARYLRLGGIGQGGRDWWREFLYSRDRGRLELEELASMESGVAPNPDPLANLLLLPGTQYSMPFRSFGYNAETLEYFASVGVPYNPGVYNIEHTMLRRSPSGNDGSHRRLFELPAGDSYNRHRVLSKIVGNSTTRSNVFYVFIKVDYFEVVEDDNGQPHIGGMMEESPGYRGFFVVDRSLAPERIRPDHFTTPQVDPAYYHINDKFNFRTLVRHRLHLPTDED